MNQNVTVGTSQSPSAGAPTPGDLAEKLAYWSIVPLFPIGFVALLVGMFTVARGGDRRQGWTAIILGSGFGIGWFAVLLWFLLRHIESP